MGLDEILRRGVAEIIVEDEFRRKLASGRPLRLKQGFDPSRPDLHLGHAVGLRKLRQLQELGHQVILIVGDWTAQIGDPSGESATRPMLTAEDVRANAQTYLDQFFKIVDPNNTEVRWQSEWYGNFDLAQVIKLTNKFTVAQMLAREDFSKRMEKGVPISVTELLYPLLQAYDSVAIEADVEFGGLDQKFNCLVGRELQRMVGQQPQDVFLVPILVGTDGVQKMSKSLDNYIALNDEPKDMYGKVMRLPDPPMLAYFEWLTDIPMQEVDSIRRSLEEGKVHPMDIKMRLAREIVTQFHGAQAASGAEDHFRRVSQEQGLPPNEIEIVMKRTSAPFITLSELTSLLCESGAVASKSEARRLYRGGSIDITGTASGQLPEALEQPSGGAAQLRPYDVYAPGGYPPSPAQPSQEELEVWQESHERWVNILSFQPDRIPSNRYLRVGKRRFVRLVYP